jgi:CHAD domain-containing protein
MIAITAETSVAQAARLYWQDQLSLIGRQVDALAKTGWPAAGAYSGSPERVRQAAEAVHDLRVAVRRCQSIAGALAAYMPKPWPAAVGKALVPLRKACDRIRDLDVLLDWLQALQRPQLVTAGLLDIVHREHDAVMDGLMRFLSADDWQKNVRKLQALLRQHESGAKNGRTGRENYRVQDIAAAVLLERAARITRWREPLRQAEQKRENETILHRLRIAGKEFRYTLEILAPALSEKTRPLRDRFMELQDCLGELHDRIRFADLIESLSRQGQLPPELTAELQRVVAAQRQELWQVFQEQWQAMTPSWFAQAVLAAMP